MDDGQVKQLFMLFDEEMKRRQMIHEHFGPHPPLHPPPSQSGRLNVSASALSLPNIHGPRMSSIPQLASQWRPVNRSVKYTLEASE